MVIKQGIFISVLALFLFTGLVSASDTEQAYQTRPDDKISSPTVLPGEFAGELRTGEVYTADNPEKIKQNKVDLTKAMIGKFRINGI
ncbi:MAG: hypothetical protein ACC635_01840 [Acidiferrobacterales bacterium]